ncbi:hypothetical protein IQ244_01040 [Nostoc sp. LEGE 06077]|uniref:hypothetical protein n=1 Tax=Nostoc sp. LEGE 06077 TaxID=915325 RepID=UPI0018819246|nr:hypothetical protein [Nostoc sp. LEGE 06077]MBE9205142.1 hypothetical protein [Nostoc sp. LEGE 06077]
MSNRHYPPAYLRYLKARLLNFSKPAFWGTAIFLSVLGLVIREYWSNPNAFTSKQNSEATTQKADNSSLSAEDKAIAADIDNLPVLYNDVDKSDSPAIVSSSTDNSKSKKGKDFLQDVINKQKSAKEPKFNPSLGSSDGILSEGKNPFVAQTENLLQFGTQNSSQLINSASQPQGSAANPYAAQTGINQTPINPYNSISPSPTIFAPSSPQLVPSNTNSATSNPSNTFGQPAYNGVPQNLSNINSTTTNFGNNLGKTPSNSVPQSLPTNNQNFLPNTSLNSSTGYIQPTVPTPPVNYYNGANTVQPLTNQLPSTTTTQPVNSSLPTNTTPYSAPNSSAYVVTPAAPASYQNNRYFRGIQLPSNTSVPGQSTGGVQGNPYGY